MIARTAALRESEEKLRENEYRFGIARAAARIIVLDWDIRNDELRFSDSPVWLRGPVPVGEQQYPHFKDQVHPDDRSHFLAIRQRAMDTLEGQTVQFRVIRTDGVVVHIQSYQTVFPGPDGKAARMIAIHQDITASKHTEATLAENQQRLRESEARYRNLYVNNPLMYFTLGIDGVIASVNTQGAKQLGYAAEDLVGQPVTMVFTADLHEQVTAQINRCFGEPGRVHTWEITTLCKDGTSIWVRESAVATFDEGQTPLMLIMCENISERRRTEIALRDSERRMRTLLDAIPDFVRLKDTQGRYIMVNRAAQESLGLSEQQIVGKTIFELRPSAPAARIEAEFQQALVATGPIRFETYSYSRQAAWREAILAPIRDDDGIVTSVVSITRDITERKQVHLEALREREERYRTLVEQASDMIYRTDPNGFFTYINFDAASRVLGYARDDMLGHHFLEFVHADYRAQADLFYRGKFKERARTSYFEFPAIAKDGRSVWVGQHVEAHIRNDRIIYHQTVCRNISDRVAAQQALRESNEQLHRLSARQEQLVESERTRIARDLHDGIGQSLNLARIKIGDLAQRPDARVFSAPLREVMDIIDDTNTIIRTLEFDLSPPVLRELGLAPALEWLADELRRMYGLHVNLSDDGEPKPLDQLRRAIAFRSVRELLINVVRHAGTNRAHVDMQLASNTLVVTVSDEGKGFEAAVTPSGFGLQSVRERLTHVGGRTDIAAAPDEGTVVTLTLPLRLGTTEEITA